MAVCKNCTDTKKCILHTEKSSYSVDWNKTGFLNKFYKGLLNYIIEFIGKDELIGLYNTKNIQQINAGELTVLDDTNYLLKVYEYFNGDNSDFHKIFDNRLIVFDHIFFPDYDGRDRFNYSKIISKLKKIHFNYCKFSTTYLELSDIEVFFQDCEFFDWYSISNSNLLTNESNIIYQMCIFNENVSISKMDNKENIINYTLFNDCEFKKNITSNDMEFKKGVFDNSEYNQYNIIDKIELYNCIINDDFILRNYEIKYINLSESTFNGKVKIQECILSFEAHFYNTKFLQLADFNKTDFYTVNFKKTDFNQIAVFAEAKFYKDIYFTYTKFFKKSIFRDMIVKGKLDLRNTIFDDEANFLDIRSDEKAKTLIEVKNRETARIIKNFYENSNNVIESNKFYTLEMGEREKELNDDIKEGRNIFEWITFKTHALSSNHSQDWVLATFWIICITFLYSYFDFISKIKIQLTELTIFPIVLTTIIVMLIFLEIKIYKQINNLYKIALILLLYFIYSFATNDFNLGKFSNNINPFSIMSGKEILNFATLIYKIVIAYLIYQLVISIRQNTRRK